MKTTLLLFTFIIFSTAAFAQDLLGKDYDYVINALKKNGSKYKTEKLDVNRTAVTEYNQLHNDDVSEKYYFTKEGNQLICKSILIFSPRQYFGLNWERFALRFEGYEKTNYVADPLSNPVYKAKLGKWFKTNHYMSIICLDNLNSDDLDVIKSSDNIISLGYYLDTSTFKTK